MSRKKHKQYNPGNYYEIKAQESQDNMANSMSPKKWWDDKYNADPLKDENLKRKLEELKQFAAMKSAVGLGQGLSAGGAISPNGSWTNAVMAQQMQAQVYGNNSFSAMYAPTTPASTRPEKTRSIRTILREINGLLHNIQLMKGQIV